MTRTSLTLLAAALAAVPSGEQDAKKWGEALATYQKLYISKDPLERSRAAWELGNATSEKHDKTCWQLVSALLRQELAREGANGRTEEKVSGEALDGCVRAFKKITAKEVLAEMTKVAKNKAENPRVRLYVTWGLAVHGDVKDLADLADDKLPMIQVGAIDALAERPDVAAPAFLRFLHEERTWEVKLSALQGLEKTGDDKTVDTLLDNLGKVRSDEGRLKDMYLKILKKLTKIELGTDDPNAWRAAWTAKKDGNDPGKLGVDTMTEPTEFYGLKTRSTRIVFVLDRTGSMAMPGSEPTKAPAEPRKPAASSPSGTKETPHEIAAREEATRIKKKWDDRKVATRIDVAKKELINTVYSLSPKVHFNVIWYESNSTPWKTELVPATWVNKYDSIKHTDNLNPSGPTNIWDALEMAYKMLEVPNKPEVVQLDKKANYATSVGGADTFFLMTDGVPNEGRISKPDEILAELRKVNRLRKVTVHAICVGDVIPGAPPGDNPDPVFLKKIADENGGEFTHIRK